MPSPLAAIAEAARLYSRSQIREGSTQLQNNIYEKDKQKVVKDALAVIRRTAENSSDNLNIRNAVTKFEDRIATSKKYSKT